MAGDPTLSRSLEIENCVTPQGRANPIDRETVRSINEIGHLTGKQMIHEWAENAEIIEVLRGLRRRLCAGLRRVAAAEGAAGGDRLTLSGELKAPLRDLSVGVS